MNPFRVFRPGRNPWTNGLRLALLNVTLAIISAGSFMGVLYFVSWLDHLRLVKNIALPAIPFPYPVLMFVYSIVFLAAWFRFGRQLPNIRRERTIATLVGAAPLFGMSLLGYIGLVGALIFDDFNPDIIPTGSFFVFGAIATLILLAGITCVGLISLTRGKSVTVSSASVVPTSR